MSESARRSALPSREHVWSFIETSRALNAQKATQISPSAMLEVMSPNRTILRLLLSRSASRFTKCFRGDANGRHTGGVM